MSKTAENKTTSIAYLCITPHGRPVVLKTLKKSENDQSYMEHMLWHASYIAMEIFDSGEATILKTAIPTPGPNLKINTSAKVEPPFTIKHAEQAYRWLEQYADQLNVGATVRAEPAANAVQGEERQYTVHIELTGMPKTHYRFTNVPEYLKQTAAKQAIKVAIALNIPADLGLIDEAYALII